MLVVDEDAVICDFAETYNIYDYRRLPLRTVAALASGLRDNSRIRMKMSGNVVPLDSLMLASIRDSLALLWWAQTDDCKKGLNRPSLVCQILTGAKSKTETKTFTSGDEFDRAWAEITKKGGEK